MYILNTRYIIELKAYYGILSYIYILRANIFVQIVCNILDVKCID